MRSFEEVNKQYNDILKAIEEKKSELNSLEVERNRVSSLLWESRLLKDILTKEDFNELFKKYSKYVWSNPYFNECTKESNCIQVVVDISCKYFKLDEENKIVNTYNADDNISKSLIGKFVDISSYEGTDIRGNHKLKVGIIKNNKFIIED